MGYLVAIDQGTTGSTVIVLDTELNVISRVNREFSQHYPQPGWVEHEPEQIWCSVLEALKVALDGLDAKQIVGIGITNQRETTVVWERATGKPIHRAIVWQCRRTEPQCQALREAGLEGEVTRRTGLVLDPYFSGTKVRWILDHTGAQGDARDGKVVFWYC